ncbi:MAG: ABC transporter ATP-binding protein [Endomicrobia bacterium]|nr:ABC transporter ATP-binding protein [Endomicrobiia bacterium]MCL2506648.1 ABC transporter ATP-binding protein [Endomicrobiia bacterium]
MTKILDIQNLTVKFGEFTAVDNITFSVEKGEIFGFLGANGAGKTTTIRALCGLVNISSGKMFIDGKDVSKNTKELKPRIGYMSQKFTLYQDLTIKENMIFSGALYMLSEKESIKRMKEVFEYVNFKESPDEMVKNMSGGSKQIVSLAASILHNPEIIFLDEPTAGISPVSRKLFWDLISKLSSDGKTIFVTTHYMDEAEYCRRIAFMQNGRIVALDSPENLKAASKASNLEEAFINFLDKK